MPNANIIKYISNLYYIFELQFVLYFLIIYNIFIKYIIWL